MGYKGVSKNLLFVEINFLYLALKPIIYVGYKVVFKFYYLEKIITFFACTDSQLASKAMWGIKVSLRIYYLEKYLVKACQ